MSLCLWFSAFWLMFFCVCVFIFISLEAYRASWVCGLTFFSSALKNIDHYYFQRLLSHIFSFPFRTLNTPFKNFSMPHMSYVLFFSFFFSYHSLYIFYWYVFQLANFILHMCFFVCFSSTVYTQYNLY